VGEPKTPDGRDCPRLLRSGSNEALAWKPAGRPPWYERVRDVIGYGIAHVSYSRLKLDQKLAWQHRQIAHELVARAERFASDVPPHRVDPGWAHRLRTHISPDYLARRRANDRRYRARKRAAPRPRPTPVEPGFLLSSRVASSRSSSLNRPAIRGSGGFATMSSNEYWSRSASSSAFHPSDWPHLRRTPLMYGTSAGRRQPSSRPPFSPAACATTSSRRGLGRSCRRTPARSGGKPRRAGPCVRVSGPNFACAPRPPIG
jgi:hypothetical protein